MSHQEGGLRDGSHERGAFKERALPPADAERRNNKGTAGRQGPVAHVQWLPCVACILARAAGERRGGERGDARDSAHPLCVQEPGEEKTRSGARKNTPLRKASLLLHQATGISPWWGQGGGSSDPSVQGPGA